MSRLRRLVVSDRWFFITCRLHPRRRILSPLEFATLAAVIDERRAEHGFLLTAWVFLPDHEKVQYIHLNPVEAGLVERAEDWRWSSVRDYTGNLNDARATAGGLAIHRVLLPADGRTRI